MNIENYKEKLEELLFWTEQLQVLIKEHYAIKDKDKGEKEPHEH